MPIFLLSPVKQTSKAKAEIVHNIFISEDYICRLLHGCHKMLAACNIQGERAREFTFDTAQSQYFVILIESLFYRMA